MFGNRITSARLFAPGLRLRIWQRRIVLTYRQRPPLIHAVLIALPLGVALYLMLLGVFLL